MKGRTPPPDSSRDDLERTAELPVLDVHALDTVPVWADDATVGLGMRGSPAGEAPDRSHPSVQDNPPADQALLDELAALRAQNEEQEAALAQAQTRIQELVGIAGQQSAALAQSQAQVARLEAELAAGRQAWLANGGALAEGELQRHTEALLAQVRASGESLRLKEAELAASRAELAQSRGSEERLFAAAQQAQAAERALREQLAAREQLIQEIRQELHTLREVVRGEDLLADAPDGVQMPQPRRMPVVVSRLLVRTDSDAEVAHVLGERTRIGRSADNDLQVDVTSISRHHAVILAGPGQTVIEDLRSTNGVRVNGRRVRREPLRDGDTVHIGKAQFRFVLRAVVEAG